MDFGSCVHLKIRNHPNAKTKRKLDHEWMMWIFIVLLVPVVVGWEVCLDGSICPNNNICCGNHLCMSNVDDPKTTNATAECCINEYNSYYNNQQYMTNRSSGTTGCGPKYICSSDDNNNDNDNNNNNNNNNNNENTEMCRLAQPDIDSNLPKKIPRNQLCTVLPSMLHIYAVPIHPITTSDAIIIKNDVNDNHEHIDLPFTPLSDNDNNGSISRLRSYFSPFRQKTRKQSDRQNITNDTEQYNKIPVATFLTTSSIPFHDENSVFTNTTHIIILIHGSRRNVDDYLCCTYRAVTLAATTATDISINEHMISDPNSVLFIAPWFPVNEDGIVNITTTHNQRTIANQFDILRWIGDIHDNDTHPFRFHTWRYGAGSINHPSISSYDVVDTLLSNEYIYNRTKFPNLRNIVLTGHSAGGQYVQRYTLLSNHIRDCFNYSSSTNTARSRSTCTNTTVETPTFRTVVANPKSYAYLDARRWMTKVNHFVTRQQKRNKLDDAEAHDETIEFRIPNPTDVANCLTYNQWEWGLEYNASSSSDNDTILLAPYVQRIIESMNGSINTIIERYATRDVLYLSGEQDVLHNGDCNDHIQGKNRYVRSERYYNALQQIYMNRTSNNNSQNINIHKRIVVPNVPHDHCLMYQSIQGQRALFGIASAHLGYNTETIASYVSH